MQNPESHAKFAKVSGLGQDNRNQVFLALCATYAPATLRRRLKNLVSVGSLPPFSVFAKLQQGF